MGAKVYVVCNDISESPLNAGYRLSLTLIKVGGRAGSAYLAFSTFELAERYPKPEGRLVLEAANLPLDCSRDFSKTPVLLLESDETIQRLRNDPMHFPYEQHLFTYTSNGNLVPAFA